MTDIAHIRNARQDDAAQMAELFAMASDGVAEYIWGLMADDYPGLGLIEIGAKRYARSDALFSYRNCRIAEVDGATAGMLHAYPMVATAPEDEETDPVLRPYAELEVPTTLYISGAALYPPFRGSGIGSRLIADAREKARAGGAMGLSLLVFEQNRGAVRLYERLGFKETDRRPIVPDPAIHAKGDVLLMVAGV